MPAVPVVAVLMDMTRPQADIKEIHLSEESGRNVG